MAVNLSADAVTELRSFIRGRYGADNVPEAPQEYKNKSKNAQEAHEAIRVTSPTRIPEEIKEKTVTGPVQTVSINMAKKPSRARWCMPLWIQLPWISSREMTAIYFVPTVQLLSTLVL